MTSIPNLIDNELWSRAGWLGLAFLVPRGAPPGLGLVFGDADAGLAIFRAWRKQFPDGCDADDLLRVSLVDGDIPGQSTGYTLHLRVDFEVVVNQAIEAGRIDVDLSSLLTLGQVAKRMNPKDRAPLDAFKRLHAAAGEYQLVPLIQRDGFEPIYEVALRKRKLLFRHYTEIVDVDDPDRPLLHAS